MRVLLVEDDPTTSKSIEMMLTHANLNVYSTDLGEEGNKNHHCSRAALRHQQVLFISLL